MPCISYKRKFGTFISSVYTLGTSGAFDQYETHFANKQKRTLIAKKWPFEQAKLSVFRGKFVKREIDRLKRRGKFRKQNRNSGKYCRSKVANRNSGLNVFQISYEMVQSILSYCHNLLSGRLHPDCHLTTSCMKTVCRDGCHVTKCHQSSLRQLPLQKYY